MIGDGNLHVPITQDEIQVEIVDNQLPCLTQFLFAIETMKVPELKESLKLKGINTKGKKLELKNRLLHAVNEGVCVLDADEIDASQLVERKEIEKLLKQLKLLIRNQQQISKIL